MCGFTAFLSADGELAPAFQAARTWADLLRHRGPDGEASYTAPGVGMHFVRLSILDLSERGMQPMRSRDGRYVMVCNGEIINFRALAVQYGVVCRGRSDSEVLVELWARLGEAVLPQLRGMFAFVIYDTLERTAVAARDPFGIKPLYYTRQDDLFMFASEMTPLLVALGGEVALDETRIIRFLRRAALDDGEGTCYRTLRQVPPGHRVRWTRGQVTVTPYHRWSCVPLPVTEEPAQQAAYYDLLVRTVGEYLYADVPVGVSLSGGFDSSLLAHLVHAHECGAGANRLMFTRGYEGWAGDELSAARQVAERYGFTHHPVLLSAEEVPGLLEICSAQQEHPITSLSVLAFHKLYQAARALGLKVLLEGHGGDELWAGYASYQDLLRSGSSQDGSSFALNEAVVCSDVAEGEGVADGWGPVDGSTASPLCQRQLADLFGPKLQRSLRFVDRASMRAAVEVRVPYLDAVLALPALRLPDTWKVRDGELRSFVRRMACPHLGEAIAFRPKVRVQDPQRFWLQGALRPFVSDLLESRPLFIEPFVDVQKLRGLYEGFLNHPERFENITFIMLPVFLEVWYRAMRASLASAHAAGERR